MGIIRWVSDAKLVREQKRCLSEKEKEKETKFQNKKKKGQNWRPLNCQFSLSVSPKETTQKRKKRERGRKSEKLKHSFPVNDMNHFTFLSFEIVLRVKRNGKTWSQLVSVSILKWTNGLAGKSL